MPQTSFRYLTEDILDVNFKDLFDTGISISFAIDKNVYFCDNCEIVQDWDNYDVEIKHCRRHMEMKSRQTELEEFCK